MTDILRNNSDNIIVMNNIAIFNFYLNKIDRSYEDYKRIIGKSIIYYIIIYYIKFTIYYLIIR